MAKAKRVKGLNCNAPVIDNARRVIDTRLRELLSFGPYVDDPRNITELHDLRIAAKRLRYTLELFRFAFPSALNNLIDEVKTIQEHIGDMHDADVMIERIVEVTSTDAMKRAIRLVEMASSIERGTIAQRHQRIRAAMTNRATPRDEVAFYTLIAHRADDRDRAYASFVQTWRQQEQSDFPGRLRRCVGLEAEVKPPVVEELGMTAPNDAEAAVQP